MRWFGTCGLAWFVCLMAPIGAGAVDLALPASGIKAPYSPLAVPTRMVPLVDSMETLLNQHYHVITAHQAGGKRCWFSLVKGRTLRLAAQFFVL